MAGHRRFFVDPTCIKNGVVTLSGHLAHQITRVLRLTVDDEIILLDGLGNELLAKLTDFTKMSVTAAIISSNQNQNEPQFKLTLALGLPKNDKAELVVQKCCELGISSVIIVDCARSTSHIDPAKAPDKLERLRKISQEAAEQCGRGVPAKVEGIYDIRRLAKSIGQYDFAVLAWEDESKVSLKEFISNHKGSENGLIIVGPEGGFDNAEVSLLTDAGAASISLGKRILRVETAAIAACCAIMYDVEGEL